MNLFGLMETSGEAMQAERMRAEVVAANMANAETTHTAAGGPYRRSMSSSPPTRATRVSGFAAYGLGQLTAGQAPACRQSCRRAESAGRRPRWRREYISRGGRRHRLRR